MLEGKQISRFVHTMAGDHITAFMARTCPYRATHIRNVREAELLPLLHTGIRDGFTAHGNCTAKAGVPFSQVDGGSYRLIGTSPDEINSTRL